MAAVKKPSFPSKACPECKAIIPARSLSHEKCGWTMREKAKSPAVKKKLGRPAAATKPTGGISLQDIEAVKALADRIGVDQVKKLADVMS